MADRIEGSNKPPKKKEYLYKDECFFNDWFYLFARKILYMADKKEITYDSLYPVQEKWETDRVYSEFKGRYQSLRKKGKSFASAMIRPLICEVSYSIFLQLLASLFGILSAFAIKGFLEWCSSPDSESLETSRNGWVYGGIIFIGVVIRVFGKRRSMFVSFITQYRIGINVRALVYGKFNQISSEALRNLDIGKVSNTISTDVFILQMFLRFSQTFVTAPVLMIGITGYMWYEFGVASMSIPIVFISIIFCQILINKLTARYIRIKKEYADKRAKFLNEVITGIKNIKFQAWEGQALKRLQSIRAEECKILRKFLVFKVLSMHIVDMGSTLALLTFFFIESYLKGNTLSLAEVYLIISLVSQMQVPMKMMSFSFDQYAATKVAVGRIESVMDTPTRSPTPDNPDLFRGQLRFENYTGGWFSEEMTAYFKSNQDKTSSVAVQDLTYDFESGKFYSILGGVGAGKTSLLLAALEDLTCKQGKFSKNGSVAYISQNPFLLNASLRENILFQSDYNEERYKEVLIKCCLLDDLKQLPGGDLTEIGERGINLSGGQKQRITIARAMYANKDIYLVDDCLSALDAEVGRKIFYEVFKKALNGKTVIMVTHASIFLPDTDEVLLMKNGKLAIHGSYDQIKKNPVYLDYYYETVKTEVEKTGQSFVIEEAKEREDNPEGGKIDTIRQSMLDEIRENEEKEEENYKAQMKALEELLFNIIQKKKDDMAKIGALTKKEDKGKGLADFKYLWLFLKAYSRTRYFFYLLCGVLFVLTKFFADFWVGMWTGNEIDLTAGEFCLWYGFVNLGLLVLILMMALTHSSGSVSGAFTINNNMIRGIMKNKLEYFDMTPIGIILNRCTRDVDQLDTSLAMFITMFQFNALQLIGIFTLMMTTVPFMIVFVIITVFLGLKISKKLLITGAEIKRVNLVSGSPIISNVSETMNGAIIIRSYAIFNKIRTKFIKNLSNLSVIEMHERFMGCYVYQLLELLALVLLMFVIISIIIIKVYQIDLLTDPNVLGLCINWVAISSEWIGGVLFQYQELNAGINGVERLVQMSTPLPGKEEPDYTHPKPPTDNWPRSGDIELHNVNIRYRENLPLVLKDINLHFKHKEKVGIIGRTGSGKSTIILALKRILELVPGPDTFIKVDGALSDSMGLKYYRGSIVLIPQDPFLLSGTVRSNIDPDNKYPDEEIEEVLEETQIFSNLSSTIRRVMTSDSKSQSRSGKDGDSDRNTIGAEENLLESSRKMRREVLEFEVKEGGSNLSQGQRQLLCIARAIISRPKILLMDEATANIDSKSDQIIQKIIKNKFNESTVITIAHRLNTIIQYDKIVVMSDGRVTDQGSPIDLLEKEGIFRDLVMELGENNFEKMKTFAQNHTLDPVLD